MSNSNTYPSSLNEKANNFSKVEQTALTILSAKVACGNLLTMVEDIEKDKFIQYVDSLDSPIPSLIVDESR